jgi:hypothetical protein
MNEQIEQIEPVVIGTNPPAGLRAPAGSTVDMILGRPRETSEKIAMISPADLEARLNRWISLSQSPALLRAQGKSWFYTTTIQQLAYLDKRLIEFDQGTAKHSTEKKNKSETQKQAEFEHFGLSAMWVTMGFQVLYVLEQDRKNKKIDLAITPLKEAKNQFVRLRSPFAKNIPNRDGDFLFPYYGGMGSGSASWSVDKKGTTITRIELADVLMGLLVRIAQMSSSGSAGTLAGAKEATTALNSADIKT